jgi:hypothetical protein
LQRALRVAVAAKLYLRVDDHRIGPDGLGGEAARAKPQTQALAKVVPDEREGSRPDRGGQLCGIAPKRLVEGLLSTCVEARVAGFARALEIGVAKLGVPRGFIGAARTCR